MKTLLALIILMLAVFLAPGLAQDSMPTRYSYNVSGRILDENSYPASNITVCLVPSGRPINGRIPCVKTDKDGKYSIGTTDIPDKYTVMATNSESIFVITNGNARSVNSKPLIFRAKDESKKINLKLKAG